MKKTRPRAKSLKAKTVVLVITGSIAAYRTVDLVQRLREEGARVICVMTEAAKKFIGPLTLRAVSGEKVYHDLFALDTPYDVLHTSLAEEADLVLVAPASANFLARLATGQASDLASSMLLVARCPILVVPAMNDQMYTHPLTQQNLNRLKEIGYQFIDPIVGHLVCGKEAIGHIPETEQIVAFVCDKIKA